MKTPAKYKQMEFKNLLLELVILFTPRIYAELGVKDGLTFNAISQVVEKSYAVDIKKSKSVKIGNNVEFFEMTTTEFYEIFKERKEKIDFIFIDADHKKESVLEDIRISRNLIQPYTGLIFAHDTFPIKKELITSGYCDNAWEAIKEIKEQFYIWDLELITLPGPWAGLTIFRYTPNMNYGWMDKK